MKKLTVPLLNILLACGVVSILVGIFLLLRVATDSQLELSFLTLALVFTGAVLVYLSLALYRRALFFFVGLYLCCASILNLIAASHFVPLSIRQLWPAEVIICGVCLLVTSFFKNHRLCARYFFPALSLIVLGSIFLLFSLNIVHVSFASVFFRWWPVLLVLGGASLIALYLYQQAPDSKFPYDKDDSVSAEESEE